MINKNFLILDDQSFVCLACDHHVKWWRQMENHIKSKKHERNIANVPTDVIDYRKEHLEEVVKRNDERRRSYRDDPIKN